MSLKLTEAEECAGDMGVATYIMLYHDIRWSLINFDLMKLGFK